VGWCGGAEESRLVVPPAAALGPAAARCFARTVKSVMDGSKILVRASSAIGQVS
jgi:hypothetical protein